jgi:DedD protein
LAQDSTPEDGGEIRRKAITRLVVAGVVTVTALGALWWLDNSGKPAKRAPPKPPSPIVAAPTTTPAPTIEAPTPSVPTEATAAPTQPPPPPVVAEIGATTPSAPPAKASQATTTPAPGAPGKPVATATTVAPPPAHPSATPDAKAATSAKPEAPNAYVVQLGVFSDPANARELVERLEKAGVRARMETRVQVGPFANRQEAEKARAEIAKLGVKGVVATK